MSPLLVSFLASRFKAAKLFCIKADSGARCDAHQTKEEDTIYATTGMKADEEGKYSGSNVVSDWQIEFPRTR